MPPLAFKKAFHYPFNRAKGLWNILWVLLPFVGWFALGGFIVRIVKEFSKGKFKKLPIFNFKKDLKLGFFMFLKSLPFIIIYSIILGILTAIDPWLRGVTQFFLSLFVIPILFINFFNKETVQSLFEFEILKSVLNNLKDYTIALLKGILLGLIFLLMSIILIGIPAGMFTPNMFLADFYRRRVK